MTQTSREQFVVTGREGATVTFSRCRWCRFTRGRLDVVEAHERMAHMPQIVALEAEQAIRQQTNQMATPVTPDAAVTRTTEEQS